MTRTCTNCGHSGLQSKRPDIFHYNISGMDNVYLLGGVTAYICPKCGEKSISVRNIVGLHRAIAFSLATTKRRLSGQELRFLREHIGYSAAELAELVDYNENHLRKIEAGFLTPKGPYELFLRLAVLREIKAPSYDLRELSGKREFKIEELRFENKTTEWKLVAA